MPHAVGSDTPIAEMLEFEQMMLREEVIEAMASVPGAGFEKRQVRLSIPTETVIEKDEEGFDANREYKPFIHIRFAFVKNRPESILDEVCKAAAQVMYRWFKSYDVKEIQYTWEIDDGDRFGRFPAKKAA